MAGWSTSVSAAQMWLGDQRLTCESRLADRVKQGRFPNIVQHAALLFACSLFASAKWKQALNTAPVGQTDNLITCLLLLSVLFFPLL